MLWLRAGHIIGMVCWFAGLFYLPRLFVYHADSTDMISRQRFAIMERRLYYGIMYPAAIWTTLTGVWLLSSCFICYLSLGWMQVKLGCVLGLWAYHWACGYFIRSHRGRSSYFFRWFNEIPTILLILIVCMVIVRPF